MGEYRRQSNVIPFPFERRQLSLGGRENILLVSDQKRCLDSLRSIPLFRVETAASAVEFFRQMQSFAPRAVFLDSQLSWANPLEVIREITAHEETPIVLLISQKKQTHILKAAYQAGISDVLFAPYRREDILEALTVLLRLHFPKSINK